MMINIRRIALLFFSALFFQGITNAEEKTILPEIIPKPDHVCGKLNRFDKEFIFQVPEAYIGKLGISYDDDSPWISGGIQKKENPCLYDLRRLSIGIYWPSLKPFGIGNLLIGTAPHYFDIVGASLIFERSKEMEAYLRIPEKEATDIEYYIRRHATPNDNKAYEAMTIEQALSLGTYNSELGLYFYRYAYMEPPPRSNYRFRKKDLFWKLEDDNRVSVFIVCEYLAPDPSTVSFKQARCKQTRIIHKYRSAELEIEYMGGFLKDWREIEGEVIKLYDSFITERSIP